MSLASRTTGGGSPEDAWRVGDEVTAGFAGCDTTVFAERVGAAAAGVRSGALCAEVVDGWAVAVAGSGRRNSSEGALGRDIPGGVSGASAVSPGAVDSRGIVAGDS